MPPLDGAEHLVTYLFDVGPMSGGEAITYQEIQSWASLTGHVLDSWEATTLRRLSGAYCGEYFAAGDPQRPAPHVQMSTRSRDAVADGLAAMFGRMEQQDERQG